MELTIGNLKKVGSFTGEPVKKEITWNQNGKELKADVYVRRLSYHSAVNDLKAFENRNDLIAARIASCICHKNGKPVFTIADINGTADPKRGPLDSNLTIALFSVIAEVNGLGESTPEGKKD